VTPDEQARYWQRIAVQLALFNLFTVSVLAAAVALGAFGK
jgi:hypothetical protein